MRRSWYIIILTPIALACDPLVARTLRLTPSPAPRGDSTVASIEARHRDALAASDRLAVRFGLEPAPPSGDCARSWRLPYHRRREVPPWSNGLSICVESVTTDALEVQISEIARQWSPKGDSLQRMFADTFARYGTVVTVRALSPGSP